MSNGWVLYVIQHVKVATDNNLLTLVLTVERRQMTVVSRGIATDDTVNDKLQVWL